MRREGGGTPVGSLAGVPPLGDGSETGPVGCLLPTPANLIRIPAPGQTVVIYAEPSRRTRTDIAWANRWAGRLAGYTERAEPGAG